MRLVIAIRRPIPACQPCSTSPFRSDSSDVQSENQLLNSEISRLGGDQAETAGSWQEAENRANGGG
jgi:hypothetical protein